MTKPLRIAIIGAGLAGLRLAQCLTPQFDICIFEKSKGLGGRMSTRRADVYAFDHGAQYFTARGAEFRDFLAPYIAGGIVSAWEPRLAAIGGPQGDPVTWAAPRYVAVPGMNALCKAMAETLQIRRSERISQIAHDAGQWHLTSESGADCGLFDWVVSTAPAAQTAELLPAVFSGHDALQKASLQGCYSLMLGFEVPVTLPWDAAVVQSGPLAWIARNDSKPGRETRPSLLCQSSNVWADAHIEDTQEAVRDTLCEAFSGATGLDAASASYVSLHKWRYAKVETPTGQPFLLDGNARLAAAGDWCGAGRVEAAFDSATALGDALLSGDAL